MIVDLIIDRYYGEEYSPKKFYNECVEYGSNDIPEAMDSGMEVDVKCALCEYIIMNNYNHRICDFINNVCWLAPQQGFKFEDIISIE